MLSTDGGNTYTELGSGTDIENITVSLDTPVTGRIALVIVGTKPRLVLGTATIGTGEEENRLHEPAESRGAEAKLRGRSLQSRCLQL